MKYSNLGINKVTLSFYNFPFNLYAFLNVQNTFQVEDSSNNVLIKTTNSNALGFFGATPIAQPTTGITPSIITPGVGSSVDVDTLFDGYTLAQIVKAMRDLGHLA